jgi:truncated hemoglobin YjbI
MATRLFFLTEVTIDQNLPVVINRADADVATSVNGAYGCRPLVRMNAKTVALVGGPGKILELTTLFYKKVFDDPILSCLFEQKSDEHARRMALFILDTCGVNKQYTSERMCGGKYDRLKKAHDKAKNNPLRDHRKRKLDARVGTLGGPFTESQKRHWLGHFFAAVDQLELHPTFQNVFKNWLTFSMGKYGPFVQNREHTTVGLKKRKMKLSSSSKMHSRTASSEGPLDAKVSLASSSCTLS